MATQSPISPILAISTISTMPATRIQDSLTKEHSIEIDIKGFAGPLDVLLSLARVQKVDLREISILELAKQYLVFIKKLKKLELEIAADYLVMAAWLAYLKSRLLLPEEPEEEISAQELSLRLKLRLQKLQAMREAGDKLMECPQLGRDVFARNKPEGIPIKKESNYSAGFYELLAAYTTARLRHQYDNWTPTILPIISIEDARKKLESLLGHMVNWTSFNSFLSKELELDEPNKERSMMASSFVAVLGLVHEGRIELRQANPFGEILMKQK